MKRRMLIFSICAVLLSTEHPVFGQGNGKKDAPASPKKEPCPAGCIEPPKTITQTRFVTGPAAKKIMDDQARQIEDQRRQLADQQKSLDALVNKLLTQPAPLPQLVAPPVEQKPTAFDDYMKFLLAERMERPQEGSKIDEISDKLDAYSDQLAEIKEISLENKKASRSNSKWTKIGVGVGIANLGATIAFGTANLHRLGDIKDDMDLMRQEISRMPPINVFQTVNGAFSNIGNPTTTANGGRADATGGDATSSSDARSGARSVLTGSGNSTNNNSNNPSANGYGGQGGSGGQGGPGGNVSGVGNPTTTVTTNGGNPTANGGNATGNGGTGNGGVGNGGNGGTGNGGNVDNDNQDHGNPTTHPPTTKPPDKPKQPPSGDKPPTHDPKPPSNRPPDNRPPDHPKNEGDHGKSGEPHGRAGEDHGKAGEPHAKSGEDQGKLDQSHGKAGQDNGKSNEPHGKAGEEHGKSGQPQGNGNGPKIQIGGQGHDKKN